MKNRPHIKPLKIKAFTILEVTISMAISAIVIMITYTAYQIISKGYINFNDKNDGLAMLITLDNLLKQDFIQADAVLLSSNGFIFKKDSSKVIYELGDSLIVRKSTINDSFPVKIIKRAVSFNGLPVQIDHLKINEEHLNEIENYKFDQLDLTIKYKTEMINNTYIKTYSSSDLFN